MARNAMTENPSSSRREAVDQVLEAASGRVIEMSGTSASGLGALVILDVPDSSIAPAIAGVAVSAGAVQNVKLTRLFTMDDIKNIRQNAAKVRGAYRVSVIHVGARTRTSSSFSTAALQVILADTETAAAARETGAVKASEVQLWWDWPPPLLSHAASTPRSEQAMPAFRRA